MSIYPIGSYVEIARGSVWKAAVVKDADDPDDEILVNYLESGQEEWLCYRSSGIRKIDKPPDAVKPKPQPVKETPPIIPDVEEKPMVSEVGTGEATAAIAEESQKEIIATDTVLLQSKYKVGDSVMAAWSKSKNFQARVEAVLPNNEYRVQFDDGLKKIVSEDQMTKEADILPDPLCPKYTTRHKSIDFNSLQNATEEPSVHKKKKKKKDKSKKIKFSFPQMEKSKVSAGESKNEIVTQAEIHHAPDIDVGGDGEDEKLDVTGCSPAPAFDITQPVLIHRKDGTSQYTTPVLDPKLPPGWYKHKAQNNGRWQGLLVNSENKKFFGRKNLLRYFKTNKLDYNPDLFDFSYMENPKKRRSIESNSEKKIKTLPPSVPSTPTPTTPTAPLFCDFNVSISGNYVCPSDENCKKEFRKENLLMMHLKHYHQEEFKNKLPPTLKVADLAYARTNSMDDDETPTKPVKKSSGSFDNTQSVKLSPPAQPVIKVHLEPPPPPSAPCPPPTPEPKVNQNTMQSKLIERRKESTRVEIMDDDSDEMEVDFEDQIALFEITKKSDDTKSKPSTSSATASSRRPSNSTASGGSSSSGGTSSDKKKKDTTPEKKEPPKSEVTSPPSIKYEKMKKEEVVNCICGVLEEDGLMIQCDICLCWQHSQCSNIATESEVPEKYVCKICKKPPLQRKSFMYAYDQDWLNKGTLPTLDPSNKQTDEEFIQTQRILRETHAITGNLCKLSDSMHNSSIKLQIAQEPNHPKHYLWSQCIDVKDQNDPEEVDPGPRIPKPEAPIDSQECRLNLLTQVEADYDLMEQKLNELEAQICSVEADCSNLMGNPANDKPTLQMLIRDLETLRTLAIVN